MVLLMICLAVIAVTGLYCGVVMTFEKHVDAMCICFLIVTVALVNLAILYNLDVLTTVVNT